MSKREKKLAHLRQNPKNIRFHELETILLSLDFEKHLGSGSHVKFILNNHIIVVPKTGMFLKTVYIKQVLKVLDEIEEE
jgi:hypothetical protein